MRPAEDASVLYCVTWAGSRSTWSTPVHMLGKPWRYGSWRSEKGRRLLRSEAGWELVAYEMGELQAPRMIFKKGPALLHKGMGRALAFR